MFDFVLDTFDFGPLDRVTVEYDTDSECPLAWGWFAAAPVRPTTDGKGLPEHNSPDSGLSEALQRVNEAGDMAAYYDGPYSRLSAMMRAAERSGYDAHLANLSADRDFLGSFMILSEHDAAGTVATLQQWLDGDIYTLTHERAELWHNEAGGALMTWHPVDSVSGIYGTTDMESLALECFNIQAEVGAA